MPPGHACLMPSGPDIRNAKAMTITVTPSGGGEPVALAVGLDGCAEALNRVTELAK